MDYQNIITICWRDGLGVLEKGSLGCGLSKPIMGFQSPSWAFVSRKMAQKSGGHFSEKKRRLRQRTHKFRASRNLGAIFPEKKSACGNVPTNSGLPEIWGPFFWKKKGACGNVVSRSGLPKNPKIENSQNRNGNLS